MMVQIKTLHTPATSGKAPAEVTQIAVGRKDARQIAVGHADGTVSVVSAMNQTARAFVQASGFQFNRLQIRLWNLESGVCDVTLSGHKGQVTALKYNVQGGLLASGAQDTDIIIWDVAAESGLYRLRGHQDQVTDLVSCPKLSCTHMQ